MPRKSAAHLALVPVDGLPSRLVPPASLSKAERTIFLNVIGGVDRKHFLPTDVPLLSRYCEIAAASDIAAAKLRADIKHGRPSQWLSTQERLLKLLITLGRQLRLSPLSRKQVHPLPGKGGGMSAYDVMRMEDGQQ